MRKALIFILLLSLSVRANAAPSQTNKQLVWQTPQAADAQDIVVIYADASGDIRSPILKVRYQPNTATAATKANLYVLSIGTTTDLSFTMKDACDFANAFRGQGEGKDPLYGQVTIFPNLMGAAATGNGMGKTLEQCTEALRTVVKADDIFILFLSSHGFRAGDDYYIVGSDLDRHSAMRFSSLKYSDVMGLLATLPCKKLIFIDACQNAPEFIAENSVYKEIKRLTTGKPNFAVFTSSSAGETSIEMDGQGLFTAAILEALSGKADKGANANEDGYVSVEELKSYLYWRVPQSNPRQHPDLVCNTLDNPFLFYVSQFGKKTKLCEDGDVPDTEGSFGVKILKENGAPFPELTNAVIDYHVGKGIKADTYDETQLRRFNQIFIGQLSLRPSDPKSVIVGGETVSTVTIFATIKGQLYEKVRYEGKPKMFPKRDVLINYEFEAPPDISESDLRKRLIGGLKKQLPKVTLILSRK